MCRVNVFIWLVVILVHLDFSQWEKKPNQVVNAPSLPIHSDQSKKNYRFENAFKL